MGIKYESDDQVVEGTTLTIAELREQAMQWKFRDRRQPDGLLKWKRHQLATWGQSRDEVGWAILLDMRLGKSSIVLLTALWLYQVRKTIDSVIIIGKRGQYMNWVLEELEQRWPTEVPIRAAWWSGYMLAKDFRLMEQVGTMKPEDGLAFAAFPVESFSGKRGPTWIDWFMKERRCLSAVDESTSIKHEGSKRSRAIVRVGMASAYRRILTGTPLPERPLDAYGQWKFLEARPLGYKNMTTFRNDFAVMERKTFGHRSFFVVSGYRNTDRLNTLIMKRATRYLKHECLDVIEPVWEPRWLGLTDEQEHVYRKLQTELSVWFEDGGHADATNAMHKLTKLHQCVQGFVTLEDGMIRELPNEKIPAMMDDIEGLNGQLIIWATYRHSFEMICRMLRENYGEGSVAEYWGGKELVPNKEAWLSGRARFFVGNPEVGGYGLTMPQAEATLFFSNSFKSEARTQAEQRMDSSFLPIEEQKASLFMDYIVRGTIDFKCLQAHRTKRALSAEVLGDEWREWVGLVEPVALRDLEADAIEANAIELIDEEE